MSVATIDALTPDETSRLTELESVIERGKQTFLEVGNALLAIREEKLYRPLTFGSYCEQRWGFTRDYAYKTIRATQAVAAVADVDPGIHLPSERHARIVAAVPDEHQARVAELIADKPVRVAEEAAREYRERNGVGRTFNRHPRLVALAEEVAGLEGRWNEEMCKDLTPPQARKQLRAIDKAIAMLEQARAAVEYRAATMHSWGGR